jgi:hypothetical protein
MTSGRNKQKVGGELSMVKKAKSKAPAKKAAPKKATAKKSAPKKTASRAKSSGKAAVKYEQVGAPWWKRLPLIGPK